MGISIKKYTVRCFFCADQIDVIMNFAVITNVVIKRVHGMSFCSLFFHYNWLYSQL